MKVVIDQKSKRFQIDRELKDVDFIINSQDGELLPSGIENITLTLDLNPIYSCSPQLP